MKIHFYKYQGTGNDFVLLDNRKNNYDLLSTMQISKICDRRFGIGADGLMLLNNKPGYDFEMRYFNSDGGEGSMCGNGGRCIVKFAHSLGIIEHKAHFAAIDGEHIAQIKANNVSLKMLDVHEMEIGEDFYYLNTGSPHYVKYVKNLKHISVVEEGKKIRYNERFKKLGTNINFVEVVADKLHIRTYERGVEDETFSCGTGATAVALTASTKGLFGKTEIIDLHTLGGELSVRFKRIISNAFEDIWLEGAADFVFEGNIDL
jgi:diaminopimelate epimerase